MEENTKQMIFKKLEEIYTKGKVKKFNAIYCKENIKGIFDVVIDTKGENKLKNWNHVIIYADDKEEPMIDEIESDEQLQDLLQNIDKKIQYETVKIRKIKPKKAG